MLYINNSINNKLEKKKKKKWEKLSYKCHVAVKRLSAQCVTYNGEQEL